MKDLSIAYAMKKRAQKFADGGMVESESQIKPEEMEDVVERIMKKRMAVKADELPNEFDELELNPPQEFSYTGANSGDELGDKQVEEDDEDIVNRVMKSRAKKDRMPSPA